MPVACFLPNPESPEALDVFDAGAADGRCVGVVLAEAFDPFRDAAAHAYNYTLVVGDKEQMDESVSVRRRGSRKVETCSITTLLREMKEASRAFQ